MRTMLVFSVILEFLGALVLVSGFQTSDLPGLYKLVSCETGEGCAEELRIEKFYNVIATETGEIGIGDAEQFGGFDCSGRRNLFGGIRYASTGKRAGLWPVPCTFCLSWLVDLIGWGWDAVFSSCGQRMEKVVRILGSWLEVKSSRIQDSFHWKI
mmetsp:Transcript_13734/g.55060  ORF Transcript_13734/g.55060 Transcript_13734/m.55060 type:complete len:155 (-) Transcript_13734:969-1433(-)